MMSETGGVKVLTGFEQDTADAAEAQPARPGHFTVSKLCRHCVRAKGKESPHHESSPGGVSMFATDYMFMGEDGTPISTLAGYDALTEAFFANVVPCKGTSHGYAERALARNVLSTGHQKVILQSDQATDHHRRQT